MYFAIPLRGNEHLPESLPPGTASVKVIRRLAAFAASAAGHP